MSSRTEQLVWRWRSSCAPHGSPERERSKTKYIMNSQLHKIQYITQVHSKHTDMLLLVSIGSTVILVHMWMSTDYISCVNVMYSCFL